MSDHGLRELERRVANTADPADRMLLAHKLIQAGRTYDALDVLCAELSSPEIRAAVARRPAWSHTRGPGNTACLDVRPIRSAPTLRWTRLIEAHPDALGCLLASPLGVVAQSFRSVGILDPETGAVRAGLESWNGDTAALAGDRLFLCGVRQGPGPDVLEARDIFTGALLGHHTESLGPPAVLTRLDQRTLLSSRYDDAPTFVMHGPEGFQVLPADQPFVRWCEVEEAGISLAVQPDGLVDSVRGHDLVDDVAADAHGFVQGGGASGLACHEFDDVPRAGGRVRARVVWERAAVRSLALTPTIVAVTASDTQARSAILLLDRESGDVRGEVPPGEVAATPGLLYVAHSAELCAYDDEATPLWRVELPPDLRPVERLALAGGALFGLSGDGVAFCFAPVPGHGGPPPDEPAAIEPTPPDEPRTFEDLRGRLSSTVVRALEALGGHVEAHATEPTAFLVLKAPKTSQGAVSLMRALERSTHARHTWGFKSVILQVPAADVHRLTTSTSVPPGLPGPAPGSELATGALGLLEHRDRLVGGGDGAGRAAKLLSEVEAAVAKDPAAAFSFDPEGHATLRVDSRTWAAGRFEVVSIAELRARAKPIAQPGAHLARFSVIRGADAAADIGSLQAAAGPGTLFQVASQFNALEAPGPYLVPVQNYVKDPTQGPRASVSAFPGTFLRHYAAPGAQGRFVQRAGQQLDLLEHALDPAIARVESGYLRTPTISMPARLPGVLNERFDSICVGVHEGVQVAFGHGWGGPVPATPPRIAQVFTSTIALGGYSTHAELLLPACRPLLRAAYLGTLLAALALRQRTVVLTAIGGGVFGNPWQEIVAAVRWALGEVDSLVPPGFHVVFNAWVQSDCIGELDALASERSGRVLTFGGHGVEMS